MKNTIPRVFSRQLSPSERFFRSLKTESGPKLGYSSLAEAKNSIINDIVGYYSQRRSHHHNGGISLNAAEARYWNFSKTVASFT